MIEMTCAECFGTGDSERYEEGPVPPCGSCGGSGVNLVPGAALLRLGCDRASDLITVAYVYERMHAAQSFRDGWEARHADCSMECMGSRAARYADLRDYLTGEFDTDPIVAALVALWITREDLTDRYGDGAYWLRFHPSFYEAEAG